ncbi:two-component regulator propeller domain-containing protein [Ignavibacterium album]|uniref:ligand-binding sensor domain-containing protein n=1 Tax=Ignavibacterium album TaxID=591197 RepID=UPI0026EAAEC5|nr:two-component regulator propeller domain-containing protein [Ignavibacterium album]
MLRKFLITLFVILFFSIRLIAQQSIVFNHLTVSNGLSQNSVTCIFQDRKGFMWFGTQDGLNRFDGYKFKIFKNIPSDTTSLSENFIFSIFENSSGELFVETQSKIIHKYNPLKESFTKIANEKIDFTKSKLSTVGAVLYEPNGIKWIGGAGRGTGLERIDTKTGVVTKYKNDPKNSSSLTNDKVYSIFRDSKNSLWIGTSNGLDKLDEKTGKFTHFKNDLQNPESLSDNWVWPIFEDSKGNLWLGTVRGGLSRYDSKTNSFVNYRNNPDDSKSINDNFIFSIYEDRSGIIWIGTNSGGINYFHPDLQVFERVFNLPDNKNSLSDNSVLSLLADSKGNYWIGTRDGGLDKYDYKNKKFINYSHQKSNPNSLISNSVLAIEEDRDGILWIGTFSSGMNSFDPKTGIFKKYVNDPANPNSLTDNRVYSILEDKEGIIWIGTYGGGLNRLDKSTQKITAFKHDETNNKSISANSTWSIAEDYNGNIWIGTFGGGINVLDKSTLTFSHFRNNPNDASSLVDDNIIRVFMDKSGNMWFGTTKGLCRYDPKKKNFKSFREANGLANDFVYGILEDDNGFLWLSTNNGLSRFDPKTETFKNYYSADGLLGNEFNQNAYAKDERTGRLLFGGPNGLNIFDPAGLKDNEFLPPVAFTEYLRYNTDDEEGKPITEKGITYRDSISLTYKDNIISIDFAALNYLNNSQNQYRYKLEGFNENWIQLGNNHSITFTNLSPGDYRLLVIGSNNDGLWNEAGASLFIQVLPPWWRTNIAYGIYFILVFGFLFGVRRYEINRREQKAQIRESALRFKASEAEKRALQIENERKTKELEEARQLQLSMLPKELPQLPHLEIAAFMRTATEVGGDYYDFIVQEDGILNVAFGDATGHGLQAGTMVTLMKGFFTADSSKLGLQDFLSHCSRVIKDIRLGRILMSFTYMKIENHKIQITSAGMPPIYYYHNEENLVEEIIIQGMPLGAMRNASYNFSERELKSGDVILLLTDGLPEQMNNNEEMFDYSRVKSNFKAIASLQPSGIIEKLIEAGDKWMNGKQQDDDITFVVIRVK